MAAGFSIKIPTSIRKDIARIPSPWSEKIESAIDGLADDPYVGEKMMGKLKDARKLRVWPYRVLFWLDKTNKRIVILEVGHRGSVSYN